MSGKTDVQFFYVVVTTNENPGSNQSLASVRVLFDGGTDRLPPCRTHANTFCALQHDFVCMQTRFTPCNTIVVRVQTRFAPCNTISYACKHVLHCCNTVLYACKHVLRLAIRFCMRANTFYIVATTHSVVNMSCYALQQPIRWSI